MKLVGGKKVGARFGTSITPLGDIDLDSYNGKNRHQQQGHEIYIYI